MRDRRALVAALLVGCCAVALGACSLSPTRSTQRLPFSPIPAVNGSAGGPAALADPTVAALNDRILSHVSASGDTVDLPLGPGDLIEISVFEVDELSKLKLRIPMGGIITLPLIGRTQAEGRSAIELEADVRTLLQKRFMHDPQVSVFVHEHTSQRISLTGAVNRGGMYTIKSRYRVADALALGEGLAADADHVIFLMRRVPASAVHSAPEASVLRPGPSGAPRDVQVMVPIDLDALASGRDELNVALEAGDVIHVPRAGSYYVGGSVERPGSFVLKGKTTAEQAIIAAGGPRTVGDWDDVRIYRARAGGEPEIIKFSLKDFEKGRGGPPPELQKNDVVMLGQSVAKTVLLGALEYLNILFSFSRGI